MKGDEGVEIAEEVTNLLLLVKARYRHLCFRKRCARNGNDFDSLHERF